MKISKFQIKSGFFGKRIPKTLRFIGEHAFLSFLALFFSAIVLSGVLLYQTTISAQRFQPETLGKPRQFEEQLLKNILERWTEQQKKFVETGTKQYPDPFWRVIPGPEEELTP